MALKETVNQMKALLAHVTHDLEKAVEGNKAASQRVRTATIKLEKVAKTFRKESVSAERGGSKAGKKSASKPKAAKKAKAPVKKAAAKKRR
jgi:hypothetical protein